MMNSSVLVLNRSFVPIHVTSLRRAFSLVYRGAARVVNPQYETFDFEAWVREAGQSGQEVVGTPRGEVPMPCVILLRSFNRIPRRHLRYSRHNVFERDRYTCQYCGNEAPRAQLNLDHVVPRSLGGRTCWENVVCSCIECNRRKGGRTPEQARLRLLRQPTRPRWSPWANLSGHNVRYKEWGPFLSVIDSGRRAPSVEA
ncbi:HNH endonuclease [Myxococcota bacterium]|nr:HNH endonuclease [Myxococcota bacterium]